MDWTSLKHMATVGALDMGLWRVSALHGFWVNSPITGTKTRANGSEYFQTSSNNVQCDFSECSAKWFQNNITSESKPKLLATWHHQPEIFNESDCWYMIIHDQHQRVQITKVHLTLAWQVHAQTTHVTSQHSWRSTQVESGFQYWWRMPQPLVGDVPRTIRLEQWKYNPGKLRTRVSLQLIETSNVSTVSIINQQRLRCFKQSEICICLKIGCPFHPLVNHHYTYIYYIYIYIWYHISLYHISYIIYYSMYYIQKNGLFVDFKPIFDPMAFAPGSFDPRSEEFRRAADHFVALDLETMAGWDWRHGRFENQWWDQDHITTIMII